jgi:predicted flap endonuclease-1-like 5' DNA nuclease
VKLLQLGHLFALPLQSAVRAQNLAFQETLSFLEEFGTERGFTRTFKLRTERMVEEIKVDSETGKAKTEFRAKPVELSIPLLALMPPPVMQLQEMNVEFGVEIVEPKSEPIKLSSVPGAVRGISLAPTLGLFAPPGAENPTTIKVRMKITREVPEGMARLGDILADMLSGTESPSKAQNDQAEAAIPVGKIRGIDTGTADLLKKKGITTVSDLIAATETKEGVKELAKTMGVSERRIMGWRRKAKLLTKGEK